LTFAGAHTGRFALAGTLTLAGSRAKPFTLTGSLTLTGSFTLAETFALARARPHTLSRAGSQTGARSDSTTGALGRAAIGPQAGDRPAGQIRIVDHPGRGELLGTGGRLVDGHAVPGANAGPTDADADAVSADPDAVTIANHIDPVADDDPIAIAYMNHVVVIIDHHAVAAVAHHHVVPIAIDNHAIPVAMNHHAVAIIVVDHHVPRAAVANHHMVAIVVMHYHAVAATPVNHNTVGLAVANDHAIRTTVVHDHRIAIHDHPIALVHVPGRRALFVHDRAPRMNHGFARGPGASRFDHDFVAPGCRRHVGHDGLLAFEFHGVEQRLAMAQAFEIEPDEARPVALEHQQILLLVETPQVADRFTLLVNDAKAVQFFHVGRILAADVQVQVLLRGVLRRSFAAGARRFLLEYFGHVPRVLWGGCRCVVGQSLASPSCTEDAENGADDDRTSSHDLAPATRVPRRPRSRPRLL
jgi:hypothetical protein